MRILLANHHMNDRPGSALSPLDLATALKQHAHAVALFTYLPGPMTTPVRDNGIPVFSVGNEDDVRAFNPELLHVHHTHCLYHLCSLGIDTAVLYSSLGPRAPLE